MVFNFTCPIRISPCKKSSHDFPHFGVHVCYSNRDTYKPNANRFWNYEECSLHRVLIFNINKWKPVEDSSILQSLKISVTINQSRWHKHPRRFESSTTLVSKLQILYHSFMSLGTCETLRSSWKFVRLFAINSWLL